MAGADSVTYAAADMADRTQRLTRQMLAAIHCRIDRMFALLFVVQWLGAILLAGWVSPYAWAGVESRVHPHLWGAVLVGGLIVSMPLLFIAMMPGKVWTRHIIAVAQMLMSALLIHLTGGRIETHFHVFGSLAFLAFYRDWTVLLTASGVVAADHYLRGILWPESVYGTAVGAQWRWLEHAGWVVFEDIFLIYACWMGVRDLREAARRQVELEQAHAHVEDQVRERTRELRESEARFRALAMHSPVGIFQTDADGQVVYVNDRWLEIVGRREDAVCGKVWHQAMDLPEAAAASSRWQEAQRNIAPLQMELRVQHRQPQPADIWVDLQLVPWRDSHGQASGWIGTLSDVTAFKEIEQQLRAAKAAAEAAHAAKSEFLANMSHEIRTPMNGIIGMTELLMESEMSPEQRGHLRVIKNSAEALLAILNDILDFSKIEAGKLDLDPTPVLLRDLIYDTLEPLAVTAGEKGLELTCDVAATVPETVWVDPVRLRQLLVNLLSNAIKFTPRGEVSLQVRNIQQQHDAVLVQFSVTDTGIGIPADKLQAIFEPFTQADGSTTRRYGGTGLGLTICKRLVTMMGGRIWVTSTPNVGSTFTFEIPLRIARGSIERRMLQPVDLRGLPILVVDDNATNRRVLAETLRLWGAQPICAAAAAEAWEELQRLAMARQRPAAILLDAMMPETDGFQLAECIKNHAEFADIPIIMLTSADRKGDALRCRELGIAAYLLKPVKLAELNQALSQVLSSGTCPTTAFHLAGPRPSGTPRNHHCGDPQTHPLKVLLAEDNPVNQMVAVRMLERLGHQVTVAGNGQEAVTSWQNGDYDVILMDVQMPDMDGFAATTRIRELEAATSRRPIPIVAMTAHAMKGDRERCLAAGMDDYLAKPVRLEELQAVLARISPRLLPRPTAEPANGHAAVAPFDKSMALQRLGGDESLYQELVVMFHRDTPSLLAEIQSAMEIRDAETLRRLAHSLKGSAAYVGAQEMSAAAYQLERLAAAASWSDIPAAWQELAKLWKQVQTWLESQLPAPVTSKA